MPGVGQREPAPSPARSLSLPSQQPGRDQLLELPRHRGLVQAEVGGQVGRARLGCDVEASQQRVGDQGQARMQVITQVTGRRTSVDRPWYRSSRTALRLKYPPD